MQLLARREHSRAELERKLHTAFDHDAVSAVLDELETAGWLCDQRFAEQFVRARAERGFGPVRIRHELSERGVEDDLVGAALDAAGDDWRSNARRVRRRRFGDAVPDNVRECARQTRFLEHRGFTHEQVRDTFRDDD